MDNAPFMISSYPRAILHVDGDAFFTSVEQALNPSLRGKPVVTGKERGIIACASYEAKALGIKRGVPLFEAKRLCPQLVVLPSDYESYSLYSTRMFNIMRKYTPTVEEYSVDEAFADITGLRMIFRSSYEEIARTIQAEIQKQLGLTVSLGLSVSKSLAKLGSKFRKPNGFTAIPGRVIHMFLQKIPLKDVWGFGPNTVSLLEKQGMRTACDFVLQSEYWAGRFLHKPGIEIWNELRGNQVWNVSTEAKTTYASISKSKTFTPPSSDKSFVFAKLVRNLESAFMKARRYKLRPRMIGITLRHRDYNHDSIEAKLNHPTSSAIEAIPVVREMFDSIFAEGASYRTTMVFLCKLENDQTEQYDLFMDRVRIEKIQRITRAADTLNKRFGKHSVCSATSLFLNTKPGHDRDELPARRSEITFPGETARQRLSIPRLNIKV